MISVYVIKIRTHYFPEKEKTQLISQLRFAYIIQIKYELASLMLIRSIHDDFAKRWMRMNRQGDIFSIHS